MAIVYLSLGSNKGDRIGYIQQATSLLGASEGVDIIRTSAFYESEPWNMNSKSWFVNAVVEVKTTLTPLPYLKYAIGLKISLAECVQQRNNMKIELLTLIYYFLEKRLSMKKD